MFVYLIIIITGMAAVKWKYGYRGEMTNNQNPSTPNNIQLPITNNQTQNSELKQSTNTTPTGFDKQYPLKDKLPYKGKGFTVTEYTAPLTLKMVVEASGSSTAEKDVGEWINSFGDAIGVHRVEILEATATPKRGTGVRQGGE